MKLVALACLFALGCSQSSTVPDAPVGGYNTRYTDALPPVRFRGETIAIAYFASPEMIAKWCPKAPEGADTTACTVSYFGASVMFLPLPCAFAHERFARTVCHEAAHSGLNGWSANHEF